MAYKKSNKLHIVTVVAVIRRNDGRILLLRRNENETVYPGHYTFPGGKVENNDTFGETLIKETQEECGLILEPGFILIKEKAIGRPDGQTSKSLSFLASTKESNQIKLDDEAFTEYKWVNLQELREIKHVGIEAEFEKVDRIVSSGVPVELFYADTDKVDFRPEK